MHGQDGNQNSTLFCCFFFVLASCWQGFNYQRLLARWNARNMFRDWRNYRSIEMRRPGCLPADIAPMVSCRTIRSDGGGFQRIVCRSVSRTGGQCSQCRCLRHGACRSYCCVIGGEICFTSFTLAG